jgi:hypothetical protein
MGKKKSIDTRIAISNRNNINLFNISPPTNSVLFFEALKPTNFQRAAHRSHGIQG